MVLEDQPRLMGRRLNRINFTRGRIYPSFQVNASAGTDVYESARMHVRFQIDGQNLTDVLECQA